MKIAIFDVSNAACALVVCPTGYSMMIDCGSNSDKTCPVDLINELRQKDGWLSNMKTFNNYPLTLLHITHLDDDHVRNAKKVKEALTPYVVQRRRFEEIENKPPVQKRKKVHEEYKTHICQTYRGSEINIDQYFGFTTLSFSIPMDTVIASDDLNGSITNNSSLIRWIELKGKNATFRILFGGDMEIAGWEWLINNDPNFKKIIGNGVDILVASHHGHTSGYSQKLMNLMGAPKLSILSKGSESGGETDVDSRYSSTSTGLSVYGLTNKKREQKYTLTTRSNGNIFIEVDENGIPNVMASVV